MTLPAVSEGWKFSILIKPETLTSLECVNDGMRCLESLIYIFITQRPRLLAVRRAQAATYKTTTTEASIGKDCDRPLRINSAGPYERPVLTVTTMRGVRIGELQSSLPNMTRVAAAGSAKTALLRISQTDRQLPHPGRRPESCSCVLRSVDADRICRRMHPSPRYAERKMT